LRHNIVVSFPEAVGDNVVSNDVRITSSLRCDVIILWMDNYRFRSATWN